MRQPDWQTDDGTVKLFRGDSLEILPELGAGSVDCVVTDPPYGISHPCNYKTRGRGKLCLGNDYPDVIGDNQRYDPAPILSLGLPTILWGGNWFADRLPVSGGWLVWDKIRPDDLDQATCELAWTNCVKGVRRFRHLWNGCMRASEHGESYHATQKPVALVAWCLSLRWTAGFKSVLDPYMGACATGVACIRTGRSFVGIEIDPTYFGVAVNRIKAELDGLTPAERKAGQLSLLGT